MSSVELINTKVHMGLFHISISLVQYAIELFSASPCGWRKYISKFIHHFVILICLTFEMIYRPNCVTFSGFLVNLIPLILLQALYGSDLEGPVDGWWCYTVAITYIFYTLMDNSDGKQARRTGASSPVGMLFDHFCDAQIAVINCFTIERML